MPSEAELVAQFGVSRMTVNRALKELQAEGLVERTQGVGTFAAPLHRVSSDADHPRPARRDRSARPPPPCRGAPAAREKARQRWPPSSGWPAARGVPHADRAPRERRAAAVRGPLRQPGLPPATWTPTSRAPRRRRCCSRPRRCGARSTPSRPPAHRREKRSCWASKPTTPCLIVHRSTFTRDAAITVARLVHPGTRYQLQGEFQP
jgi:GntR family histidine utilization transcriptional repressor